MSKWEKERVDCYKRWKLGMVEIERKREKGKWGTQMIREEERQLQRVERWEKIVKSNYNVWYKNIKGEGIPGYLKKGWGERRWQRVAKFRLGDEMRGERYWEEEEKRVCRMCEMEEETWKHVWEGCMK